MFSLDLLRFALLGYGVVGGEFYVGAVGCVVLVLVADALAVGVL